MGKSPEGRSRLRRLRPYIAVAAVAALGTGVAVATNVASAGTSPSLFAGYKTPSTVSRTLYPGDNPATPIKHLVVLFDENVSFDHYFGTYPYAANTDGTTFTAKKNTPTVNGLYTSIAASGPTGPLLTNNNNGYNPTRLTHAQALTSSQNHGYTAEEKAVDGGAMDGFVKYTQSAPAAGCGIEYCPPGIVMDYYDGNTTTALWNYAQNYSMSDNNWDTTFGPSTPGALNVISGATGAATALTPTWSATPSVPSTSSAIADGSMIGDVDPYYDTCSDNSHATSGSLGVMSGENIGDLLNAKHVTWGWFQGGFASTATDTTGAVCGSTHQNIGGATDTDYSPHHNPFAYYASTSNPNHLAPSSLSEIGYTDQANHNYDLSDFTDALNGTGGATLPSVSYLKAAQYQDGHPGYSDPLDEQTFLVNTINAIEQSKYWSSTAIVITYDDSDGWYDHQPSNIVNGSNDSAIDAAICTTAKLTTGDNGRCGYSQRLPLVVISPYTRTNYVSDNVTNTASVVKFIEDNWLHGERIPGSYDATSGSLDSHGGVLDFNGKPNFTPLILNPATGAVISGGNGH